MEFQLGVKLKIKVRTKLRYTQYCLYTLVSGQAKKTDNKKLKGHQTRNDRI